MNNISQLNHTSRRRPRWSMARNSTYSLLKTGRNWQDFTYMYSTFISLPLYGYITNLQNDQPPVGLIAQWKLLTAHSDSGFLQDLSSSTLVKCKTQSNLFVVPRGHFSPKYLSTFRLQDSHLFLLKFIEGDANH